MSYYLLIGYNLKNEIVYISRYYFNYDELLQLGYKMKREFGETITFYLC